MKLWVVGVGPGDPRLLTVYAVEVLKRVELVFAPLMGAEAESRAYWAALPYLSPRCTVVRLFLGKPETPQTVVEAVQRYKPKEAAFLVLGDPGLYGSFFTVFQGIGSGVFSEVEVIPGISAHQVMSARLVLPLAQGEEVLSIVPGTAPRERMRALLAHSDTCVVYKATALYKGGDCDFGSSFKGWVGENLTTEEEKIYPLLHCPSSLPYCSVVFLRRLKGPSPIA